MKIKKTKYIACQGVSRRRLSDIDKISSSIITTFFERLEVACPFCELTIPKRGYASHLRTFHSDEELCGIISDLEEVFNVKWQPGYV